MEGWFKVPRTVVLQPFFKNERMVKVWLWMMAKASHKEHTLLVGLTPVTLQPGEFVFGSLVASKELDIPRATVHRIIRAFEQQKIISVKVGHQFSIVSLTDWALSQFDVRHERDTDETPMRTNKNGKNVKNGKNNIDKIQYSSFVYLTAEEHDKLVSDYGEERTKEMIDLLNNHKGATGKVYQSDYFAILSWCVKGTDPPRQSSKKPNTFINYTDVYNDFTDIDAAALSRKRKRSETPEEGE